MNIIEIIPSLLTGGAQSVCLDLCNEFSKDKSSKITLVVLGPDGTGRFFQMAKSLPIHLIFLEKKEGFNPFFSIKLYKIIKQIQPDIIHTHLYSIGYVCLFWKFKKYRIFHTIHSVPNKDIIKPYRILLGLRIHEKWKITLVGISPKISELSSQLYPRVSLVNINNGIKINIDQKVLKKEKRFDFISCGRLSESKNYAKLLDSFSIVCKEFPNLKLILVGGGDEREKLERQTFDLGIEKNVFFSGDVVDPSIYYRDSKIFILTSNYEGNPIVILEAMSYGLPIISSSVGGIPDIVKEENGILFSSDSTPLIIAEIMKGAINDANWIKRVGDQNYLYSINFSSSKMAQMYLKIFS